MKFDLIFYTLISCLFFSHSFPRKRDKYGYSVNDYRTLDSKRNIKFEKLFLKDPLYLNIDKLTCCKRSATGAYCWHMNSFVLTICTVTVLTVSNTLIMHTICQTRHTYQYLGFTVRPLISPCTPSKQFDQQFWMEYSQQITSSYHKTCMIIVSSKLTSIRTIHIVK